MGFPAHSLSPSEHQALIAAERDGAPFIAYRSQADGTLRVLALPETPPGGRLRIGRTPDNDIVLDGDPEVSRAHAALEPGGGGWLLVDDGFSRNGSFVNGEKVLRHQRLGDRDMLLVGRTSILFRAPGHTATGAPTTLLASSSSSPAQLTAAERRVLVALCRPLLEGTSPTAASNAQIGAALHLSEPGVKTQIRALFRKLEVDDLPQNQKRAELARRALERGLVTARDLRA